MTVKTAIDVLRHYISNSEHYEATQMAIDALEKQMPKKSIKNCGLKKDVKVGNAIFKKGTSVLSKCPDCGSWLRPVQKYCSDCGKAIDWSDEE